MTRTDAVPTLREFTDWGRGWGRDQGAAPAQGRPLGCPFTRPRMKLPGGSRVGGCPPPSAVPHGARTLSRPSARVGLFPPATRLARPSPSPWLVPSGLTT